MVQKVSARPGVHLIEIVRINQQHLCIKVVVTSGLININPNPVTGFSVKLKRISV